MARAIILNDCTACPHKDHKGGFGSPAYVPVCRKINKDLPHTLYPNNNGTGCVARFVGGIPEWCPLPEIETPAE